MTSSLKGGCTEMTTVNKKTLFFPLAFLLSFFASSSGQQHRYFDYPLSAVEITHVEITDDFWLPKIRTIQNITIPFAIDKCTVEGRLDNFLIAGKKKQGTVRGQMPFDDTDIYKIIEGASTSLISAPNKELDATLDSIIAIIKIGQEPDGYLTTWCTIDPFHPPAPWAQKTGKRWIGESSNHELYNSGHLFEAAAAHYRATGKRNFLDIALKNADLLVKTFGPGRLTIPPGHQIVETGLIKLYRITGNEQYVQLAKYFLDLRGDSTTHALYGEYSQDQKPVVQQNVIVGHAVRAVYMYAGMTDIAALYRDTAYLNAVNAIWTNMIEKKIYLTGGIGAKHEGESLGKDYELPNLTAYGETCASIGNVYWNHRLFLLSGDSKYFDIIERSLYNGLISGISLDGKNFFYVNPLEADGSFKFNSGACTRRPWFDCSCCPTNLIRFIPSLPGLIYALQGDSISVNLYMSNKARVSLGERSVQLEQQTDYPWQGTVTIIIKPEQAGSFTVKLRLPGWARNHVLPGDLYSYADSCTGKVVIKINGQDVPYSMDRGYAVLTRTWMPGDSINLALPMNIRRVIADKQVKDDINLTALEYGPLVYCFEGIDNNNQLSSLTLSDHLSLSIKPGNELFHQKMNIMSGTLPMDGNNSGRTVIAIPYYAWSNRGSGTMKVWMPWK